MRETPPPLSTTSLHRSLNALRCLLGLFVLPDDDHFPPDLLQKAVHFSVLYTTPSTWTSTPTAWTRRASGNDCILKVWQARPLPGGTDANRRDPEQDGKCQGTEASHADDEADVTQHGRAVAQRVVPGQRLCVGDRVVDEVVTCHAGRMDRVPVPPHNPPDYGGQDARYSEQPHDDADPTRGFGGIYAKRG